MSDEARLYISVESSTGRLVVDGSMHLWSELVGTFGRAPTAPQPGAALVQTERLEPAGDCASAPADESPR